jgi:hypothetical protein
VPQFRTSISRASLSVALPLYTLLVNQWNYWRMCPSKTKGSPEKDRAPTPQLLWGKAKGILGMSGKWHSVTTMIGGGVFQEQPEQVQAE